MTLGVSGRDSLLRARIGITSDAVIELGVVSWDNAEIKVMDAREFAHPDALDNVSDKYRIIDLLFEKKCDEIRDDFYHSLDLIDSLLDCISYIGYSSARLTSYYSLCQKETNVGDVFELVVPQYTMSKQQHQISIDSINEIDVTDNNRNAIRLLRNALNSVSPEERYMSMYSALEWLAEKASDTTIIQSCENCGHKKDTGRKATRNYLKQIFKKNGKSSKEADKFNSIRAKIAHGAGTRDQNYLSKVTESASYLEEVLIKELDSLVNIQKSNSGNVIISAMPCFIHKCLHEEDESFSLISSSWIAPMKFTNLDSRENKTSMYVGAPLGPNRAPIIDPISWPNYKNT